MREKELLALKSDLERFLDIIGSSDRHLKTLAKYLKNLVCESVDPVIIEHTQRQIKNLEKVQKDIRRTINKRDSGSQSKYLDSLFSKEGAAEQNQDAGKAGGSSDALRIALLKSGLLSDANSSGRESLESAYEKVSSPPRKADSGKSNKQRKTTEGQSIKNTKLVLKEAKPNSEAVFGSNTKSIQSKQTMATENNSKANVTKKTKRA